MDKIFVKDLRVDCIIGILESERVKTQPLLVSMELEKDLKECAKTGDLDKSINYAALSERVKSYIIQRKALLLEELSEELCKLILKEFKPESVTIRLNKPEAVADAMATGVQITRTTGDYNDY
ncbi:MAG: dihydroneopterin aldolase [Succinivibrio sp.]|nr:dihydroneopterin aldolase [Succinivibrio sp.]